MSYYLYKFLKLFVLQLKKLSQYLFFIVNISSNELILLNPLLIQQVLFKVFLKVCRVPFRVPLRKLAEITTRCHSLSLVVPLVFTCCTTRCYLLSLVVICCHSLYQSLSIVVICFYSLSLHVSLVCLFTNDRLISQLRSMVG